MPERLRVMSKRWVKINCTQIIQNSQSFLLGPISLFLWVKHDLFLCGNPLHAELKVKNKYQIQFVDVFFHKNISNCTPPQKKKKFGLTQAKRFSKWAIRPGSIETPQAGKEKTDLELALPGRVFYRNSAAPLERQTSSAR